jgi:hypothetical protein
LCCPTVVSSIPSLPSLYGEGLARSRVAYPDVGSLEPLYFCQAASAHHAPLLRHTVRGLSPHCFPAGTFIVREAGYRVLGSCLKQASSRMLKKSVSATDRGA